MQVRTSTVFCAVTGYQDQVVQCHQAANDADSQAEHGLDEAAAQMAVIGGLPGVYIVCIILGIYGNRHVVPVCVICVQLLQLGHDIFGKFIQIAVNENGTAVHRAITAQGL